MSSATSNVTLAIAGREYALTCAAGEEQHLAMLGRMIDQRLAGQAGFTGQPEARRLLYAALLLADELHEMAQGGGTPSQPPAAASAGAPGPSAAALEALEALATRLERTAEALEAGANDHAGA